MSKAPKLQPCPVCFTRGPLSADVDTGVTNWNVRAERKK